MNVSPPKQTGKSINKFRDRCREWVNESQLPPAQKLVLCRLANYVNSENLIAWPSFDTLAADTGVSRRTVINAINGGRKLGVIKRIYRGGKINGRGKSNAYRFPLYGRHSANSAPSQGGDIVQMTTEHSANDDATWCKSCTGSSNDLLKILEKGSASSAALESVVGVASPDDSSDNQISELADTSEKRSGEETEISPATSDNPTTEQAKMPKQTDVEFCLEMAAKGVDMSLSKFRSGQSPPEVYSPPPMLDERPITVSQALIDKIQRGRAANGRPH